MKNSRIVTVLSIGAFFLPLVLLPAHQQVEKGSNAEKEGIKVQKIPLESIYSTIEQKKLKYVRRQADDDLDEIYTKTQGFGASNVFLVRGNDIAGALFHTRSVFTGYMPVDVPAGPAETKKLWMVAYFGVAGSGAVWTVNSVERNGKTFRLTYEVGTSDLADTHQYFAWVPLGSLEVGAYSLELFDAKQKEVTLMRRVVVSK